MNRSEVAKARQVVAALLGEATGNFYTKNASNTFVFGVRGDDEDDNTDYEDTIANVRSELTAIGFDEEDAWERGGRGFNGKVIASKTIETTINDEYAKVIFSVIARSGYYEAANLDWDIEIEHDGSDEAQTWAEKVIGETADAVEKVFEHYTTPYRVAYRMSNGETGYEQVKKPEVRTENLSSDKPFTAQDGDDDDDVRGVPRISSLAAESVVEALLCEDAAYIVYVDGEEKGYIKIRGRSNQNAAEATAQKMFPGRNVDVSYTELGPEYDSKPCGRLFKD